jgi:predicted GNAT family acetyltransferase
VKLEFADNPGLDRFEARTKGRVAGYVRYSLAGDRLDLIHTEVLPSFEGKGIGGRLAAAVLDDARERGLSVIPTCPFITEFIEEHPAYADLVIPELRSRFEAG